MSRTNSSDRDNEAAFLLRRMSTERVEIKIRNRRSVSLPCSWLTLQAMLFLAASLICSCCSLSSYLWGSASPYLTPPVLVRLTATTVVARIGRPTATVASAGKVGPMSSPTAALVAPALTMVTPRPTEPISSSFLMPSPTLLSTPEVALPLPPSVQTPTPSPIALPTSMPNPTASPTPKPTTPSSQASVPTSSPFSPPTPTNTPSSASFSSDLRIVRVEPAFSMPSSVGDEYIVIENVGIQDQDMTGWTINNDHLDTYWFPPDYFLPPGVSVRVWTKSGADTEVDLYWGSEKEVWSGASGSAYLRDPSGTLVDLFHW